MSTMSTRCQRLSGRTPRNNALVSFYNSTTVVRIGSIEAEVVVARPRQAMPARPPLRGFRSRNCVACPLHSSMSAIDPAAEPVGLTVLPPDAALRSAKPAPTDSELVIDGLTEAEWVAFEAALTEK